MLPVINYVTDYSYQTYSTTYANMYYFIVDNLINFDVRECHTNRLFCNKLWQATKFTKIWTKQVDDARNLVDIDVNSLPIMNKWILSRLSGMVDSVNDGIRSYDFHVACKALKEFLYYDFCDVFLVRKYIHIRFKYLLMLKTFFNIILFYVLHILPKNYIYTKFKDFTFKNVGSGKVSK